MKLFGRKRKASRGLPNYWNESVIERIQRDAEDTVPGDGGGGGG